MTNKRLSDEVIVARMVELRNLRKLHAHDREHIMVLKVENKELRTVVAAQQAQLETQAIQIAELQTMVFGKKRKPLTGMPSPKNDLVTNSKLPRSKDSYRRPIPPARTISDERVVSLPETCACGGHFKNVTLHDRYEEDIPLPELTKHYRAHLVTMYLVERGICTSCGRASSERDLGGQKVTLGPNVRLLVVHLVSVVGLSYSQTIQLCQTLYNLHLADGEIAGIVAKQRLRWLPAYQQLQADIRASPRVHVDEPPWPIQRLQGRGYAWVLAASGNHKSCFTLENSRGARHAHVLLDGYEGIRITDDYGVYRHLPGQQQLCWAHLYRSVRDLRYNENLPEQHLAYVSWWYEQFAGIYQQLRTYLDEPYDWDKREAQASNLWQQVQSLCRSAAPTTGEPKKLATLKLQLTRAAQDRLCICLLSDTPCDNNRAERDLRPLVLKRKRSFGSKTERGARALATVLSICMTTWRETPNTYSKTLAGI